MDTIKKSLSGAGSVIKKLNKKREKNTEHYKMTNIFLSFLFPLFIVLMAELNQGKYPSRLIMFIVNRPSVMIFNVIIAAVIFACLSMLFKKC